MPAVSGSIAIGIAWRWLFDRNGFLNSVLISFGWIKDPIQWLSDPSYVLPIAMLLTIWAGIGYYSVIFLAGLQNISEELYDAARIDGCNDFQKHWYVSVPGLRPQIVFVAVISSLAALKVFDEIYVLTGADRRHPGQRHDDRLLPVEGGLQARARRVRGGHRHGPAGPHARLLDRQRALPRARHGGRVMARASTIRSDHRRRITPRRVGEPIFWYVVLLLIAVVTVFPFAWILLTSLKGPTRPALLDAAAVHPPEPDARQLRAASSTRCRSRRSSRTASWWPSRRRRVNVLVATLAAYPLATMQFRGRDPIFYLLLATLIVPVQLTFIPSYLMAQFFGYYDSLPALILPALVSAFNIFLMRQAFRGVPNELIDAARVDGAREWRIWWQILVPLVRPSIAAVAIFTFVTSWNDFFWPSLMLPTVANKTLPVGLVALQGFFSSDFRSIAAGVTMTVVPILIFFIFVQRYFVRGLAGAVKG